MTRLYALLLFVLPALADAGGKHYSPALENGWSLEAGPFACDLQLAIPNLGSAHFFQASGGEVRFFLALDQPGARHDTEAALRAEPPPWRHEQARNLGMVPLMAGETPFWFDRQQALRLSYELEKGFQPTFYFRDWADDEDDVKVALTPVGFRQALGQFQSCVADLSPFDFDAVKHTVVHFGAGNVCLEKPGKERLARILRYLQDAEEAVQLTIGGHADASGLEASNDALSLERAWAVRDFLLDHGVPAERMTVRAFGSKRPVASNRHASGRQQNRRVSVELQRQSPYPRLPMAEIGAPQPAENAG